MAAEQLFGFVENLQQATSIVKKKEFLQKAHDWLEDDTNFLSLDEKSLQTGSSMTWQKLFHYCHSFYINTLESIEDDVKGRSGKEAVAENAKKLISLVAACANRDQDVPFLDFNETSKICMDTARRFASNQACRDMYIKLLHAKLVSLAVYSTEFTTENCSDIVDFCIELYPTTKESVKFQILYILEICIRAGSKQSMVAMHLKNKFDFFESMLDHVDEMASKIPFVELALRTHFGLALELGIECRIALCKLGEAILPKFLNFVKQNMSPFLKKYCLVQMALHHPRGAESKLPSAHAHNWDKWNEILLSIFHAVQQELRYSIDTAKIRGLRNKEVTVESDLVELAVEIYKQIFALEEPMVFTQQDVSLIESEGPSSKRARMSVGIQMAIDQLKPAKRSEEITVRLTVMAAFLKKYGSTLKTSDYFSLLEILTETQSLSKTNNTMKQFCNCCKALLENFTLAVLDRSEMDKARGIWRRVWDMALRSAGLNQCLEGSNGLLQALLTSEFASDLQTSGLLNLFIQNTINLNAHSLQTFVTLTSNCYLPDMSSNYNEDIRMPSQLTNTSIPNWQRVLSWLLPASDDEDERVNKTYTNISNHLIGEALIRCICKNRIVLEPPKDLFVAQLESDGIMEIHQAYSPETSTKLNVLEITYVPRPQLNPNGPALLAGMLSRRFSEIISAPADAFETQTLKSDTFSIFVHQAMINCSVLSHLLNSDLLDEEEFEQFPTVREMEHLLQESIPASLEILLTVKKGELPFDKILMLGNLYSDDYHRLVVNLIRRSTPSLFLEVFQRECTSKAIAPAAMAHFSEIQSRVDVTTNYCPYPLNGQLTRTEESMVVFTKILASLCFHPKLEYTEEVAKYSLWLLEVCCGMTNKCKALCNMIRMLLVLKSASLGAKTLNEEQEALIMLCLKELTKLNRNSHLIVIAILDILEGMLIKLNESSNAVHRSFVMSIVRGFKILTEKKKFGRTVRLKLIKCIKEWITLDPEQIWSKKKDIDPAALLLTDFVKDHFFEVRNSAALCLEKILCPRTENWSANIMMEWRLTVFNKLSTCINESFNTLDDKFPNEDDLRNLGQSSLKSYAAAIAYCPEQRHSAIFSILELIKLHNVSLASVLQVLQILNDDRTNNDCDVTILEPCLSYLLAKWCSKFSLLEFPYQLLGCNSCNEFLITKQDQIVVTLLQQRDKKNLKALSSLLSRSEEVLVKESSVMILCSSLPLMVIKKHLDEDVQEKLQNCYNTLAKYLSEDEIESMLGDEFPDILLYLYTILLDKSVWEDRVGDISLNFPQYGLHYLNHKTFAEMMHWVEKKLPEPETPVIVFIAIEHPVHCQNIMHKLALRVFKAPSREDRLLCFLQYSSLVHELCTYIGNGSVGNISAFLIRDIVHFLLNVVNESTKVKHVTLSAAVCYCLQRLSEECCKNNAKLLSSVLPTMVNSLVNLVKKNLNRPVASKAINILHILIVEHGSDFKSVISKLEEFPELPEFSSIETAFDQISDSQDKHIESEICSFLAAGEAAKENRVEGLQRLCKQLSNRKEQLNVLYGELCSLKQVPNTTLLNLICSLLKLTGSDDDEIAFLAAACLGELGPGELLPIVLTQQDLTVEKRETPQVLLYKCKLDLLLKYIIDPNIDVCHYASKLLLSVLRTQEGKQALKYVTHPEYLYPFEDSSQEGTTVEINDSKFLTTMQDSEIWCPSTKLPHSNWIITLTSSILLSFSYSKAYTELLLNLCLAKEEFANSLLPHLLLFVLSNNNKRCGNLVVQQLNTFFMRHFEKRHLQHKRISSLIPGNISSVKCMLDVVQFLRENSKGQFTSNLNYLHVSQAAHYCSAFFSSIYYGELWGLQKKFSRSGHLCSIEEVCDNTQDGKALHSNLVQSYKSIGDPDAIYGCGMSRLLDRESQIHYFEHCKRWDKVLLLQDLNSAKKSNSRTLSRMAPAMMNLGLQNLLKTNLDLQDDHAMKDIQLQCCWRLGKWDQPTTLDLGQLKEISFEIGQYSALKSLLLTDFDGVTKSITLAQKAVIRNIQQSSFESTQNIYGALSQLQLLQEIKDVLDSRNSLKTTEEVLDKWNLQDQKSTYRFEYHEPILSQRLCLMRILQKLDSGYNSSNSDDVYLSQSIAELLLRISKLARNERCFHVTWKALTELSEMTEINEELKCRYLLESANSFWDQGDAILGKEMLVSLLDKLKKLCKAKVQHDLSALKSTYALALRTYGSWLIENGSENPRVIIDEYLKAAVQISDDCSALSTEKADAFRALGSFADAEYQRVVKYMNSPHFKSKMEHLEKSNLSVAALGKDKKKSVDKDFKTALTVAKMQSSIDKNEIDATDAERKEFLALAMEYYVKCLALSEERVSTVFRVITLWLENKEDISENLDLSIVPSYKFIPLIPQLTPYLKPGSDSFQQKISELLIRLAEEHPHHTLPNILALKYSGLDRQYEESLKQPLNDHRSVEAGNVIKRLSKKSKMQPIIKQLEIVTTAVVELAYYSSEDPRAGSKTKIPDALQVRKIHKLDKIQVATCSLPVQKSCNYKPNGILKYETVFQLVGGIHAPKKIDCVSMDGVKHTQLCKGLDDLHLDAVMQQVFTIMNEMFMRNKNTSSRKLSVRTYNVCPLSQRSGLIEWCKNTTPLGVYLVDAHPRFNKDDAKPIECRRMMNQCEGNLENRGKRLRVFEEICSKIRPVFFNFFLENFLLPATWLEKRLAYTRSVAASSMIGYILGLGDRHVQNILIDTSTAEVIHIDFGIAFEQGLVLRIPELVPFRLSRDIESGFGISGVEGVFKKSCEAAMQVLRDNQKTILTILQVLLYNPMYVWTIAMSENQNDRSGMKGGRVDRLTDEANQMAERALLRIQQKLMGTEEGMANSVEGQVSRLIQKAQDPHNLGLMFSGWQPYL
ncbi:serine-protein kinase ATM [Neocloeon triangulifer]|uniref:serine-protein kinase ATM n=1 Tax=Neocloeon triangulifer TaxID=2078957 RepID=UPI00286F6051|nr:serine-protein kinase ATM [Neocloeon triangulifer]XP_059474326.1 serine-protein kinase ATM [Neocloeon triangulifer]